MSFFNIGNRHTRGRTRVKRVPFSRSRILGVEILEERRVLSTFFVDDNLADCSNAQFTSIQAAVTAAGTNDKIIVCKGTYTEQVIINSTKDGLELRAKNTHQAVIQAPAGTVTPAIVHVDGADSVDIIGFKITGPLSISGPVTPTNIQTGIYVGGGGSANIERNHITKIRNEPINGLQNGFGILVGRTSIGETGSAEIRRNLIDDYQKGGIVVDNVGSDAVIKDNKIIGIGLSTVIAQNGIQISGGATAKLEKNEISRHEFDGAFSSAGIILVASGRAVIKNNNLTRNDVGIDVFDAVTKVEVSHNDIDRSNLIGISLTNSTNVEVKNNTVKRSGEEGLILDGSSGNTVSDNRIERSGFNGIALFASNDNLVRDNKLERNGRSGLLVEDSDDNRITENRLERNTLDGIRVTGTSKNNRLTSNKAKKNVEHDCHDDALGPNIWNNNSGDTENVPGLCN